MNHRQLLVLPTFISAVEESELSHIYFSCIDSKIEQPNRFCSICIVYLLRLTHFHPAPHNCTSSIFDLLISVYFGAFILIDNLRNQIFQQNKKKKKETFDACFHSKYSKWFLKLKVQTFHMCACDICFEVKNKLMRLIEWENIDYFPLSFDVV